MVSSQCVRKSSVLATNPGNTHPVIEGTYIPKRTFPLIDRMLSAIESIVSSRHNRYTIVHDGIHAFLIYTPALAISGHTYILAHP
ncbi:hypothetical protein [Thalassotalea mangrovi]|uniref:Uncharacterized protein n=1 Tax=Thalassotalea mangrovi TaxID=2572245 RepID=A0A4U1B760_9GAMM|nr:hypothetical protein [Thalassotalea mangrovi]TKB46427.1 hypothetical protein E8M12_05060 [Thalassotalea mangrovi]